MSFYRKKPVVIEALQWDGSMDSYETIHARWPELQDSGSTTNPTNRTIQWWAIRTLEGQHVVRPGDYIIKGVNGEFYPCKREIFHLTYVEAKAVEQEPIAKAIHYPDCWDTAVYPTLEDALHEMTAWFKCSDERHTTPNIDAKAVEQEPKPWPQTPEQINNFIGAHFDWREGLDTAPSYDDKYCLSTHDLLSAFSQWDESTPTVPNIDAMVDRFLAWKLPHDVPLYDRVYYKIDHDPLGQHLLTAEQARAMIEHILGDGK